MGGELGMPLQARGTAGRAAVMPGLVKGASTQRCVSTFAVPRLIAVIGRPGVGKDTISDFITETFGLPSFRSGDVCRQDPELKRYADEGRLVPDELVTDALARGLVSMLNQYPVVFSNGFPRRTTQGNYLMEHVVPLAKFKNEQIVIIHGECHREVAIARMRKRGRGPDDFGTKPVERQDEYDAETYPLIPFFEERGVRVLPVDATKSERSVQSDVRFHLQVGCGLRPIVSAK